MSEEYFEVTYYTDGTMIQAKQFNTETEALDFWDEVDADSRRSPVCIKHIIIIAGRRP